MPNWERKLRKQVTVPRDHERIQNPLRYLPLEIADRVIKQLVRLLSANAISLQPSSRTKTTRGARGALRVNFQSLRGRSGSDGVGLSPGPSNPAGIVQLNNGEVILYRQTLYVRKAWTFLQHFSDGHTGSAEVRESLFGLFFRHL